ncbi:MAG: type II toxin-antitoxin system RelE/ParE family toxin [Herpetosiphonaceae bacterium]|nr:type II toxin-antitoxin system RelE/ParE family toxin [Herpetosiphonaceae bacterium]
MTYTVTIERGAQKDIAALSRTDRTRVLAAIKKLADDPRPSGCKKLAGRSDYRIRVGSIRVIYDINDGELVVTVLSVGQRGDIYR